MIRGEGGTERRVGKKENEGRARNKGLKRIGKESERVRHENVRGKKEVV